VTGLKGAALISRQEFFRSKAASKEKETKITNNLREERFPRAGCIKKRISTKVKKGG